MKELCRLYVLSYVRLYKIGKKRRIARLYPPSVHWGTVNFRKKILTPWGKTGWPHNPWEKSAHLLNPGRGTHPSEEGLLARPSGRSLLCRKPAPCKDFGEFLTEEEHPKVSEPWEEQWCTSRLCVQSILKYTLAWEKRIAHGYLAFEQEILKANVFLVLILGVTLHLLSWRISE